MKSTKGENWKAEKKNEECRAMKDKDARTKQIEKKNSSWKKIRKKREQPHPSHEKSCQNGMKKEGRGEQG